MKFAVRIIKNVFHPLEYDPILESLIKQGKMGLVITDKGPEAFKIFLVNDEIRNHWEKYKPEPIKLTRVLDEKDLITLDENKELAFKALTKCRIFAENRKLDMNLTQARYTFDRKKITFYYTANARVDFRELLKDLTTEFRHVRIDLRHIGARDETSILQGVGVCGQGYCCCGHLKKFENVNTRLAKDQGIPLTPSKITGCCGRLLCCLNYEYKDYVEGAKTMPPVGSAVSTPDGLGKITSINFLNNKIMVKFEDGKMKEFKKCQIDAVDTDVDIDVQDNQTATYTEEGEQVDLTALNNDKNSSTGNI